MTYSPGRLLVQLGILLAQLGIPVSMMSVPPVGMAACVDDEVHEHLLQLTGIGPPIPASPRPTAAAPHLRDQAVQLFSNPPRAR